MATGTVGVVAAVTAAVMALGSAPASAAYSVTKHDGTPHPAPHPATSVGYGPLVRSGWVGAKCWGNARLRHR